MKITRGQLWFLLGWLACAGTQAQSPALRLDRAAGSTRLELNGATGQDYVLQGRTSLSSSSNWELLLSLTLAGNSQTWSDSESRVLPYRFYRALKIDPVPDQTANDFRLIDQFGKSRHLYYHSTARAIVLIFSDSHVPTAQTMLSAIRTLRNDFATQGIVFWTIDPATFESRALLTARANALGVDWPVLHDRAQLVARDFGATANGEVVAIDTANWSVFYRGSINDGIGSDTSTATQHYLSDALANFVANRPITFHRTKPLGGSLNLNPTRAVSYAKDIVPLLQAKCLQCHSPGNIAPWSMTDHAQIKLYAASIKEQVLTGEMPPWYADVEYGQFTNDSSLNPAEASMLVQWVDDGAPRGDGPDPLVNVPPPPTSYPNAWPAELGTPDYVYSIPTQSLSAFGEIPYKYVEVATQIPSNVWLRAAVVRPSNLKVVHHSLVFQGGRQELFTINLGGLAGFFAAYVPGMPAGIFPPGTGKFLAKGQVITFQMHYTTTGQPETDKTQIGLYLAKGPPPRTLLTKAAVTIDLSIPPGAKEYERQASFTPSSSRDILLYELAPHMHLRGSRFKYEAFYPDGKTEVILSVPKYDFEWQNLYRYAEPKRLPAGTIIRCSGAFDNSPQNLHNPDPNQLVRFGEQTDDEMFIGYMNYSEVQ